MCFIYIYTHTHTHTHTHTQTHSCDILHSCDYLKKLSIQINVVSDEGNSWNEMWHWTNNEIGVAIQSWLWVWVELLAQSVRASEQNSVVVGSNRTQANFLATSKNFSLVNTIYIFRSKKSSSALLVREHQAPQKWCLSSPHSTACSTGDLPFNWRLERYHFYDACCSWTSSADELFLEQTATSYYMFMNSSPCHCIYCVPLFYICGYYFVHATALLKVKDI